MLAGNWVEFLEREFRLRMLFAVLSGVVDMALADAVFIALGYQSY